MSIHPPTGASSLPPEEALPPAKKRKTREEELAEKYLPKEEYQPQKKAKIDTQRIASESEVYGTIDEAVVLSLLGNIYVGGRCTDDQYKRLNDRLMLMWDSADSKARKKIENFVITYAVVGRCHDLARNLHFIGTHAPQDIQNTVNALFEGPPNKLSLEQKIQALSFIHDMQVPVADHYWLDAIIPRNVSETGEDLQAAIKEIPKRERASLIRDCLPFLSASSSEYQVTKFLKHMHQLSGVERQYLIRDTTPLFDDTMDADDKMSFLKDMSKIPQSERESIILTLFPHFDNTVKHYSKLACFEKLHLIPPSERQVLFLKFLSLIDDIMTGHDKIWLLDEMLEVPQTEQEDTFSLLHSNLKGQEKACLLYHIRQDIPKDQRFEIIRYARPLLSEHSTWFEIAHNILKPISKIPNAARAFLFQEVYPHLRMRGTFKNKNLMKILEMPQEPRTFLLQEVLPRFNRTMSGDDRLKLLLEIAGIEGLTANSGEARFVLESLPLVTKSMGMIDIMRLARQVRDIPEAERTTLLQDTVLLLTGDPDSGFGIEDIISILNNLRTIAQAGRTLLVQDTLPLIHYSLNWKEMIKLVKTMHKIPHVERAPLIRDTGSLISPHMQGKDKIAFLEAIYRVPQSERAALIQDADPLLKTNSSAKEKVDFLKTLHCIEKEKRTAFIQEIFPMLHTLRIIAPTSTSFIFYLLPESLKTQKKLKELAWNLLTYPEYRAAIIASLEQKCQSEKSSPALLLTIAEFVGDSDNRLGIHEEHPIMQHAIEILSSHAMVGEKNPFSLYKKLKTLAEEPIEFQSPIYEVAGNRTAFRLDHLQSSGKAFEVARVELPQDATQEAWNLLTTGLKQKVESDPDAKKQLEEMGTTWEEVWEGCFSTEYILGLLKLSSGKVPLVEAQFRALLHHLLVQEKTVKPGEVFSEQEKLLVMQGMSIQKCTGGKKEGIALTYNLLGSAFKYPAKGLEEPDIDKRHAKEFITDVVQKATFDQFSGTNALMQELTGVQNIEQAPHQAIYLKNLIGPLVGLRHEVIFDKNSGVLYDSLVTKPRKEVLQAFFRHFTPQVLANELMRVINNDFRKNFNIVRHLVSDFEGWDYDEETDVYKKINARGTLQLLQTTGFLT